MASGKCVYLSNKILDFALGGTTTWTRVSTVYIALSTAAFSASATGSAMSEVAVGGYSRIGVTLSTTTFPNASGGSKSNGAVMSFPAATADWGTVVSFYILDASSAGNAYWGGDLTTSRSVANGDTASFAIGSMTITEA